MGVTTRRPLSTRYLAYFPAVTLLCLLSSTAAVAGWPPDMTCPTHARTSCSYWDAHPSPPDRWSSLKRLNSTSIYSVLDKLVNRIVVGRGAAGTLYACQFGNDGSYCVVKMFHAHMEEGAMFREARMTALLSDTGVSPRFRGALYHEGVRLNAYVMNFIGDDIISTTRTLLDFLREDKANDDKNWPHKQWDWTTHALTLAKNLKKFHERGIFHGDVQARNILVTDTPIGIPRFTYVDLGQTAFVNETYSYTITPEFRAFLRKSYPYIAPELKDGAQFSKAADVYGLGYIYKTIGEMFDIEERLRHCAELCMASAPLDRPDIDGVILMLDLFGNAEKPNIIDTL